MDGAVLRLDGEAGILAAKVTVTDYAEVAPPFAPFEGWALPSITCHPDQAMSFDSSKDMPSDI